MENASIPTAQQHYGEKIDELTRDVDERVRKATAMSWTRPALFLPAMVLLLAGFVGSTSNPLAVWLGWIFFAGFVVAVTIHDRLQTKADELKSRKRFYERLIARLDRNWSRLEPTKSQRALLENFDSDVANDLDLFGSRSLYAWCSLAATFVGQQTLARWMTATPTAETILERQQAASELVDGVTLREKMLWIGSRVTHTFADPTHFTKWAAGPSWISQNQFAYRFSFVGPSLFFIGLVTFIAGYASETSTFEFVGIACIAIGFLINLFLTVTKVGPIHDIFSSINTNHNEVFQYRELFEEMAAMPHDCPLLARIYEQCVGQRQSAADGFHRLARVVRFANLQNNPRMYIVYFVLQLTCLWDFRVLRFLESWQARFGQNVESWFASLGELEVLMSASTIAYENPSWAMPTISMAGKSPIQIQGLAHPLLSEEARVPNDLTIDSQQPVLLVTGSNMAGKSTMLRSLGVNLILSRIGSPVCATAFQAAPFVVETSIRVRDSLQDGVSFFMAELKRLRDVVDSTEEHLKNGQPVLVLLDEILQGTNSRERQIAVQRVVERLNEVGAITAISTHDLELADQPELIAVSQIVHFREHFVSTEQGDVMKFDYVMRPGPTPTTNALKLLELVGLTKPDA
jgi:hypothetical protein